MAGSEQAARTASASSGTGGRRTRWSPRRVTGCTGPSSPGLRWLNGPPLVEESRVPAVLDKILRAGEGKIVRKLEGLAKQVNALEEAYVELSDAELRELTEEYKERYADGESLNDLLPEAFATVREAARRTLGQRHYDVQIMGGAAL